MSRQLLRIIDTNLSHASEGIRLLEDIAGDVLNDAQMRQQLNGMRGHLRENARQLGVELLSQRDREHALGGRVEAGLERHDIVDVVRTNAKMVQESLRVIDELARLPEMSAKLDSGYFEQARVAVYGIESRLVSRILTEEKKKQLTGLYVVLDTQALAGRDETQIAGEIVRGGAKAIQLRDKQRSKGRLLPIARRLQELCAESGVLFIVNDYLDIALTSDADGIHVGQEDLPLAATREVLPIGKVAGCSVTTLSQAVKAESEGADYIAVGSIFPTTRKANAIVVGLDTLRQVKQAISRPLVAIGGINEDNIEQVVVAGADSVAVIGAVLGQQDVRVATERLVAKIESVKRQCQE